MGSLSLLHILILLAIALAWGIPAALILKKAGFNRAWALVCLIPPFALVLFWAIALIPWPSRSDA